MVEKIKLLIKNEKGQALVMVVLSLSVLLGFAAFTTDYGYLAFQRRQLQNAADSAALASSWELPDGSVEPKAIEYAKKHTKDNVINVVAAKQNNNREVKVDVSKTYPRFFGKIFGEENYTIMATATANKYLIASLDLLPLADIDTFKNPTIKDKDRTIENDPVHFQMISKNLVQYHDYLETKIGNEIFFREADGSIKGNLGLLSLEDYSDGNNIKDVIRLRLNTTIYNTLDNTGILIEVKTGSVDSIEKANQDLSKRLEEDGWRAYVLAVLPSKSIDLTGSSLDVKWGEYLLLYVDNMSVDITNKNRPIRGTIKGVYNIYAGEYPNMIDTIEDEKVRLIK